MHFYRKEYENSCSSLTQEDLQTDIEFYRDAESSSRQDSVGVIPKTSDSEALDLIREREIIDEFSFNNTNINNRHNSSLRKEFINLIQPAFDSNNDLHARLNDSKPHQ